VLILTRYNPDPDGLVASQALAVLLDQTWGMSSRRIYYGTVDQAINRAMLRPLTPGWKRGSMSLKIDHYSAVALVDWHYSDACLSTPTRGQY